MKAFVSLILGFVVAFLFFTHLGESLYDTPYLNLFYENYNAINQHYPKKKKKIKKKEKSVPLIFSSNPPWYFSKRDSKSSSIVSPVLLSIIISLLLLFECIVRILSESSEGIKLIIIINWIFHFPEIYN